MIISHKYKYIFLKTNKTAGTSIEIALSKFCAPNDIITPISPQDEYTRKSMGGVSPQKCFAPLCSYRFKDFKNRLLRGKRKLQFYNHIDAAKVKRLIGEEVWESYYKFCVERNPWDRVISAYYWRYKQEHRPSILEFLESNKSNVLKRRGRDVYSIDGQVAVDKVCCFENLHEDLEAVRIKVGLPETLSLPKAKSSHRSDKRSYRDILSDQERNIISSRFEQEIRMFGYEF